MGIAHQIAGAFDWRIAAIGGTPADGIRKLRHKSTLASIRSAGKRR
jgi:hypothetical protein